MKCSDHSTGRKAGTKPVSIVWFRQDLRLADNPALRRAAADGNVLPLYVLDDEAAGPWRMGGRASLVAAL